MAVGLFVLLGASVLYAVISITFQSKDPEARSRNLRPLRNRFALAAGILVAAVYLVYAIVADGFWYPQVLWVLAIGFLACVVIDSIWPQTASWSLPGSRRR